MSLPYEKLEPAPYKKERLVKSSVEVRPSSIDRYGVFATKDLAPNEVIEECPVVIFRPLSEGDRQEAFLNRTFSWDDNSHALALGYGSIYNHGDDFNATFSIDRDDGVIKFVAAKPIAAGAEVLVYYGDDWFVTRGMEAVSLASQDKENRRGLFKVFSLIFVLLVLSKIFPVSLSSDAEVRAQTGHGFISLSDGVVSRV